MFTPHQLEIARLALEFVKTVASWPVIGGAIASIVLLMFRDDLHYLIESIIEIKFPGGGLLLSQRRQNRKLQRLDKAEIAASGNTQIAEIGTPTHSEEQPPPELLAATEERLMWEFRYLNNYLVPATQLVLNWLASQTKPVTVSLFDAWLMPLILNPRERIAIIQALNSHHLIDIDPKTTLIKVTPKGRRYLAFRGPYPFPPTASPTPPAVTPEPPE